MKKQVFVIHGGDTFNTHEEFLQFLKNWEIDFEEYRSGKNDWKRNLGSVLGFGYEVIMPPMPNKMNAKYAEWKTWFEKFIPHLDKEVIFVGHSLGGTFLAKYLAENKFPKKIIATFLIAPAYDDIHSDYSLADFVLPDDLSGLARQGGKIFIYGSSDDPVVPAIDFEKFKKAMPSIILRAFTDRGHFNQEELSELTEDIRSLFS